MQNEPGQKQVNRRGNDAVSDFFVLVLDAMAFTVEIFLHGRFGSRYIGRQAFAGFLVLFAVTALMPKPEEWMMVLFLTAYVKAWLYARAGVFYRRIKCREFDHTRYTGWPYLMHLLPDWHELTVKRFIEPVLVILVGLALWFLVPVMGLYLMMAGAALFLRVAMAEAYERRRAEMMHDAVIDATQRAKRFRAMSRGRR